jgi:ferrochelatase
VAHHYRHFGGVSPINAQNRALKAALETELAARGVDLPVYWGNRNWGPYLADTLQEAAAQGSTRLIAIATSAYSSYSSCRQYREDFARELDATGLAETMVIDKVRQYFDHPGFVAPFTAGVADGLAELEQRLPGIDLATEAHVLFCTHSIPTGDAVRSGPESRGFAEGGAYAAQHRAVAEVVMDRSGRDVPWDLVFQSRSGPPTQPWLEPDVNDALTELAGRGVKGVLLVPLGFVSDHMEVMWDLDEEATETAAGLGLVAIRTPTPGVDPAYVRGLVDLVLERVHGTPTDERPAETALGPWYDVCRPGCCENARLGFRPAVAGLVP